MQKQSIRKVQLQNTDILRNRPITIDTNKMIHYHDIHTCA